jgi:hypothetical protein
MKIDTSEEGASGPIKVYIGRGIDYEADVPYIEAQNRQTFEVAEQIAQGTFGTVAITKESIEDIVIGIIEEYETPPPLGYVPILNNTQTGLPRTPVNPFNLMFWNGDGFAVDRDGIVEDWANGARVVLPVVSLGSARMHAGLRNGATFTYVQCLTGSTTNALRVYDGTTETTYNYGYMVVAGEVNNTIYLVASRKAGVNGTYVVTVDSVGTVTDVVDYNATLPLSGVTPNGNWMARAGGTVSSNYLVIMRGGSVLVNGTLLAGVVPVADRPEFNYYAAAAQTPQGFNAFYATCVGNGKLFHIDGSAEELRALDLTTNATTLYTSITCNVGDAITIGWAQGDYVVLNWQDNAVTPTQAGYKVTNGTVESDNNFSDWADLASGIEVYLASRWNGESFVAFYNTSGVSISETLNGTTL